MFIKQLARWLLIRPPLRHVLLPAGGSGNLAELPPPRKTQAGRVHCQAGVHRASSKSSWCENRLTWEPEMFFLIIYRKKKKAKIIVKCDNSQRRLSGKQHNLRMKSTCEATQAVFLFLFFIIMPAGQFKEPQITKLSQLSCPSALEKGNPWRRVGLCAGGHVKKPILQHASESMALVWQTLPNGRDGRCVRKKKKEKKGPCC